ncbi:MAG TPA: metal-sensing transcriptional repressor [Alphaproteobacteria bacterium]|jgi:DNA-binding FrmR family transcriptional regulator|nr:metal-sensing transcriptional repressor [Alphaproteobacteria bacterium]
MQDPKSGTVHRLQIAMGHLQKVLDMVKEDEYCIDIVHQSMAVQAALKKIDEIILEDHLKTCVSDSIKAGHADKSIKEIMEVLEKK